ncbi:hypothetical protein CYMTET_22287, partial [Cymbomonas tetramitiformis]
YDALLLRLCGDGKPYSVKLYTLDVDEYGEEVERIYTTRFITRRGWSSVRLPLDNFIPMIPTDPPLDRRLVTDISINYDARRLSTRPGEQQQEGTNSFSLELDFIKLLPRGEEPDFILVSCALEGREEEEDSPQFSETLEDGTPALASYKRSGEDSVRNSGLGYVVIRPGPLLEQPGGQKALMFDQGGRITMGIALADVADVCLKSLHEVEARNKSFDVCYEYTPEEDSLYELVAHVPTKTSNYLTSAMANMEPNT